MNSESDIRMMEIYEYLKLNTGKKKYVLIGVIGTPLVFGLVFLLLGLGGPSNHFQSPSIETRIMGSSIITAILLLGWLIFFLRSIYLRNFIKKQWPTEEEQEKLIGNFKASVSVFQGQVKIGKDYTFLAMAGNIIETRQILYFYQKGQSSGKFSSTGIFAAVKRLEEPSFTKDISVFECSDTKKGREEADHLIWEATDVLKTMKKE